MRHQRSRNPSRISASPALVPPDRDFSLWTARQTREQFAATTVFLVVAALKVRLALQRTHYKCVAVARERARSIRAVTSDVPMLSSNARARSAPLHRCRPIDCVGLVLLGERDIALGECSIQLKSHLQELEGARCPRRCLRLPMCLLDLAMTLAGSFLQQPA